MAMTKYKGYTIEPVTGKSAQGQYPGGHRVLNEDGSVANQSESAPGFATEEEAQEYAEAQARAWIDAQ